MLAFCLDMTKSPLAWVPGSIKAMAHISQAFLISVADICVSPGVALLHGEWMKVTSEPTPATGY